MWRKTVTHEVLLHPPDVQISFDEHCTWFDIAHLPEEKRQTIWQPSVTTEYPKRGDLESSGDFTMQAPAEPITYEFQFVTTDVSKEIVSPLQGQKNIGISWAQHLGEALFKVGARICEEVEKGPTGHFGEENGSRLRAEITKEVVEMITNQQTGLVARGALPEDLHASLEAFRASKSKSLTAQQIFVKFLCEVVNKVLGSAPNSELEFRRVVLGRMREELDLYPVVDVRSWPAILKILKADADCLNAQSFKEQVRLQLCSSDQPRLLYQGLDQAATLISDMGMVAQFEIEEIKAYFNDVQRLERQKRIQLIHKLLRNAQKEVVMNVLRGIDQECDIGDREDTEIQTVMDLLYRLDINIRCCPHAYFIMKRDWLFDHTSGRGVVVNEELSPDQVADHIEDDPNYEDLLKVAVNRYIHLDRKCEAARLLARKKANGSRVYVTNRNNKQVMYLVELFQCVEPTPDQFGPVDGETLAIPVELNQILVVNNNAGIAQIEEQIVAPFQPLGIWWIWRCLDPKVDTKVCASLVVLVHGDSFMVIDVDGFEDADWPHAQAFLRKILENPQILKIVHAMDSYSLQVLARTLEAEAHNPLTVSPVLDVAVAVAATRKINPGADAAQRLSGICFDYLRLELCTSEALSNFTRRPLRDSQLHYALSLAWAPITVLRVLCAYQVLDVTHVEGMLLQLKAPVTDKELDGWDDKMRRGVLATDPEEVLNHGPGGAPNDAGFGNHIEGAYGMNLWNDEEWRSIIPMPDPWTPHLRDQLDPRRVLGVPADHLAQIQPALKTLFDRRAVSADLDSLYAKYNTVQGRRQEMANGQ
eukprot:gnl/MRDRNA2_/MRDRNA2_116250_c0_seq1.p1 gnl/MRDRNA2_/MRDRNA2_116250_c0~~gnl/MRDRNA2_/MRDRNA2_116250_c0_seq1.p1  ORF type:complete len:816 (+),score=153.47 gnl/MRDRNA2_/MRDRNA2_116250_c0_seq1:94-2541(+)